MPWVRFKDDISNGSNTMASTDKDLTIVICTHNRAALLEDTLNSLLRCNPPDLHQVDILVVANNCNDDTPNVVSRLKDGETIVPLNFLEEPEPGKSYALNTAIKNTTSRALYFIDDDHIVEPEFLATACETLDLQPDFEMICGYIMPAWDGTEPSWVHEKGKYRVPVRPIVEFDKGPIGHEITADGHQPGGGNLIVRRSLLNRMDHYFDPAMGPNGRSLEGGEDLDFVRRARKVGGLIWYEPSIRQHHVLEYERMTLSYMMRKAFLRSQDSFMVESPHGPKPYMIKQILIMLLSALTRINGNQRFYFFVRLAASYGEWQAARRFARQTKH